MKILKEPTRHALGESADDLSNYIERSIIGAIGLVLPLLLYLIAAWRPQEDSTRWRVLPSISAYYYTGAVSIFVGLLAALGVFLFAYQGYANRWHALDVAAARVAAAAAVTVAFFPTTGPVGYPVLPWWRPWMQFIHFTAATLLLSSFAFFSLYLFRRTDPDDPSRALRTPAKRQRDHAYIACGIAIVVGILWTALASARDQPIFVPECLAVMAFAVSWLVKGRVDEIVRRLVLNKPPQPSDSSTSNGK